jgi:hypothetical protein
MQTVLQESIPRATRLTLNVVDALRFEQSASQLAVLQTADF